MRRTDIVKSAKVNSGYVYVSTADTFDVGLETMVFECDASGDVLDWGELDCNRYTDFGEAENGHKLMVASWGELAAFG